MIILTKDQVLLMHGWIFDQYGGSRGVKDEGLLDSALQAPFQTYDGQELYPTVVGKIVRLGYGLITNHPFLDGNKRIGALAQLTLLELNGYRIEATDQELTDIIMGVAAGQKTEDDLNEWVISRISM